MRPETREVPRMEARRFIAKADEFLGTSHECLAAGRWNAAGLNAIHAGISAADATIVAHAGLRSAATDHSAVVRLLEASVHELKAPQVRQLTGLLSMKNTVEYEQRLLTESEARALVQHATRFCAWAAVTANAKLASEA